MEPRPVRPRIGVTWEEAQRDCAILGEILAAKGKWAGIVAVARGGLVPAALMSRYLGIRLVETVSITCYEGETRGVPTLLKSPVAAGDGHDWLVVDDLVDTGGTMQVIRSLLPRAHIAVLYAKPLGLPFADSLVRTYIQEAWIDFPWEMAASGC